MGRIKTSFELAKSSWSVLRADRELLWLPVISAVAAVATAVSFFVPIAVLQNGSEQLNVLTVPLALVGYALLAFVTIFFNAALVWAADQRMRGGDPNVRTAIAGAWARRGVIAPWAIVSATVSMVLKAIEQRGGIFGAIVARIAGIAWTLVTFLVLPTLVIEGIGVRDAVRKSSEMFRRTWGEQVIGTAGLSIVSMVAMLPGIAAIVLGAAVGGPIAVVLILAAVAYLAGVVVIFSALSSVYQTALYHYAANGMPPAAFATVDLRGAFVPRKRSLRR